MSLLTLNMHRGGCGGVITKEERKRLVCLLVTADSKHSNSRFTLGAAPTTGAKDYTPAQQQPQQLRNQHNTIKHGPQITSNSSSSSSSSTQHKQQQILGSKQQQQILGSKQTAGANLVSIIPAAAPTTRRGGQHSSATITSSK